MMSRIDYCKESIVYIEDREAFVDLDNGLSIQHLKISKKKTFSQGQQIDAAPFASIDIFQPTLGDQCWVLYFPLHTMLES